jgi:Helicase
MSRRPTATRLKIFLAYAITVHKAQGLTLERAVIDLSLPEFVTGQVYVAISRVKIPERPLIRDRFRLRLFRSQNLVGAHDVG